MKPMTELEEQAKKLEEAVSACNSEEDLIALMMRDDDFEMAMKISILMTYLRCEHTPIGLKLERTVIGIMEMRGLEVDGANCFTKSLAEMMKKSMERHAQELKVIEDFHTKYAARVAKEMREGQIEH
jgi:hypothetical protein